jgi:co-chaperonin GroES (HSP10)
MQALGDKVIIKKTDDSQQEKGSIIVIRTNTHGEMNTAVVMSAGKDATSVKRGDIVMVLNGMGITFEVDGEQYVELKESEIEAIVED